MRDALERLRQLQMDLTEIGLIRIEGEFHQAIRPGAIDCFLHILAQTGSLLFGTARVLLSCLGVHCDIVGVFTHVTQCSASLKAKVAVEAIKTHARIAQMFGGHPTQAGGWKKIGADRLAAQL